MTRRGRGVLEPSEGAGPADPGQDSGLQAVRGCSAAVLSPLVLCFITVSPGNERSRETMESDHRSSARHKLCAPPAPSLPGSPSFPAVCAVWDWGRSIHQAEGGLLDPCISVLGSPRPLGRVSRCWVPPKWGRSSHRREDVVQGILTPWRLGPETKLLKRQEVEIVTLLTSGPRNWLRVLST